MKANAHQFITMIGRQIPIISPEDKLWLAVINQAVLDSFSTRWNKITQRRVLTEEALPARRFLLDRQNPVYKLLGLNYEFMREQFQKHASWHNE